MENYVNRRFFTLKKTNPQDIIKKEQPARRKHKNIQKSELKIKLDSASFAMKCLKKTTTKTEIKGEKKSAKRLCQLKMNAFEWSQQSK